MNITLKTGETINVVEVRNYAYGPILYFLDEKTGMKYSIDDIDIQQAIRIEIDARLLAELDILGEPNTRKEEYKRLKFEAASALQSIANNMSYPEYIPDIENMDRYLSRVNKELSAVISFFNYCRMISYEN